MDLAKKDFCLLAAIGLILRQFSVASRLVSRRFARGDLAAIRRATSVRDCVRTRVIQTIVKVQLQLGVRAGGWRLDRRHDCHD
jgi:hypothetical protein